MTMTRHASGDVIWLGVERVAVELLDILDEFVPEPHRFARREVRWLGQSLSGDLVEVVEDFRGLDTAGFMGFRFRTDDFSTHDWEFFSDARKRQTEAVEAAFNSPKV